MSSELGWTTLAGAIMVIGLCGVVVPVLPGLTLIWIVALIYGFAVGFGATGIAAMVALTALLVASVVTSVILPRRTSAASGASGWAQLGGVAGAVVGFFVIPVVGIVVGALVGVLVVEVALKRDWDDAWTATRGLAKGFGISALIDVGLGLMMIMVWAIWAATVVL